MQRELVQNFDRAAKEGFIQQVGLILTSSGVMYSPFSGRFTVVISLSIYSHIIIIIISATENQIRTNIPAWRYSFVTLHLASLLCSTTFRRCRHPMERWKLTDLQTTNRRHFGLKINIPLLIHTQFPKSFN